MNDDHVPRKNNRNITAQKKILSPITISASAEITSNQEDSLTTFVSEFSSIALSSEDIPP